MSVSETVTELELRSQERWFVGVGDESVLPMLSVSEVGHPY